MCFDCIFRRLGQSCKWVGDSNDGWRPAFRVGQPQWRGASHPSKIHPKVEWNIKSPSITYFLSLWQYVSRYMSNVFSISENEFSFDIFTVIIDATYECNSLCLKLLSKSYFIKWYYFLHTVIVEKYMCDYDVKVIFKNLVENEPLGTADILFN
jgi:hypothetical protein